MQPDALIVVAHGSRRADSNDAFLAVVDNLRARTDVAIVEPAFMELAAPSIDDAYGRCVEAGARDIVVVPWFLLPGRHWERDIPELVAAAAATRPPTQYRVTAPLGGHPLVLDGLLARTEWCLAAAADGAGCELCGGTRPCLPRSSG